MGCSSSSISNDRKFFPGKQLAKITSSQTPNTVDISLQKDDSQISQLCRRHYIHVEPESNPPPRPLQLDRMGTLDLDFNDIRSEIQQNGIGALKSTNSFSPEYYLRYLFKKRKLNSSGSIITHSIGSGGQFSAKNDLAIPGPIHYLNKGENSVLEDPSGMVIFNALSAVNPIHDEKEEEENMDEVAEEEVIKRKPIRIQSQIPICTGSNLGTGKGYLMSDSPTNHMLSTGAGSIKNITKKLKTQKSDIISSKSSEKEELKEEGTNIKAYSGFKDNNFFRKNPPLKKIGVTDCHNTLQKPNIRDSVNNLSPIKLNFNVRKSIEAANNLSESKANHLSTFCPDRNPHSASKPYHQVPTTIHPSLDLLPSQQAALPDRAVRARKPTLSNYLVPAISEHSNSSSLHQDIGTPPLRATPPKTLDSPPPVKARMSIDSNATHKYCLDTFVVKRKKKAIIFLDSRHNNKNKEKSSNVTLKHSESENNSMNVSKSSSKRALFRTVNHQPVISLKSSFCK